MSMIPPPSNDSPTTPAVTLTIPEINALLAASAGFAAAGYQFDAVWVQTLTDQKLLAFLKALAAYMDTLP